MNVSRFAIPGLLAVAGMLAGCGSEEPPAQAPASTAAPAPASESAVPAEDAAQAAPEDPRELLERADKAAAEDRLFDPEGDNAFELYLKVIEAAQAGGGAASGQRRKLMDSVAQVGPEAQARAVLADLYPYGLVFAERALAEGRRGEVERLIALLARFRDDSPGLLRLKRQLAEANAPAPARPQQPEPARPAAPAPVAAEPAAPPPTQTPPEPAAPPPVAQTPPPPPPAQPQPAAAEPATPLASQPASPRPAAESAPAAAEPPKLLEAVQPRYPRLAFRRRIEGYVRVRMLVQPDGSVGQVEVIESEPEGVFDRETLAAVSRWKFSTGKEAQWVIQRIDFNLD
ncbi:MAG: hypothetical protein KatS3mg126_0731 [Lysobacteraceae bacterium]|nr:MAG: hypothetical protein KatS3mg126_0731 [Xanthomonadaceae bacterium]